MLEESSAEGRINPDLTLGTDATSVVALKANEGLASPGVKLHGAGFIVSPSEAAHLGLGKRDGLEQHIRPYRNGRDLLQNSRGKMVVDLLGLDEKDVRTRFPEIYQYLRERVWDYEVTDDETGRPASAGRISLRGSPCSHHRSR